MALCSDRDGEVVRRNGGPMQAAWTANSIEIYNRVLETIGLKMRFCNLAARSPGLVKKSMLDIGLQI